MSVVRRLNHHHVDVTHVEREGFPHGLSVVNAPAQVLSQLKHHVVSDKTGTCRREYVVKQTSSVARRQYLHIVVDRFTVEHVKVKVKVKVNVDLYSALS